MSDAPIDKRNPPIPPDPSGLAPLMMHALVEAGYRMDVHEADWAEAQEIVDALRDSSGPATLSEPSGPEGNRIRVLMIPRYVQDSGSAD